MRTRKTRGTLAPMGIALLAFLMTGGAVQEAFGQTPYVPYYGKNRIRYNDFRWHVYKTDHFEIYYYPEIESHLERVTSYAESAYQQVSSDLKVWTTLTNLITTNALTTIKDPAAASYNQRFYRLVAP